MSAEDDRELVLQRIFVPLNPNEIIEPLAPIEQLAGSGFASIAAAFRRNILAVISAATVPFQLTVAGVQHLRWQQLVTAERIRARNLIDNGTAEGESERIAVGIARQRMSTELKNESAHFGDRVLDSLRQALDSCEFADGASELLRQSTLLSWSALEVLAQDTFVELLNAKPGLTMRLCTDETTKKLFQLKAIGIETLIEHEFDLSRRMGHVLIRLRAIDSVPVMRSTFSVLLPTAEKLREALSDKILWTLNQRRHLIVHKRGVVDQEYLDKTGEDREIGEQLVVTASELEGYVRAVAATGSELLRCATEL
jgi:hypothetical protein